MLAVPESATMLMKGGLKPGDDDFQQAILTQQMTTEDVFFRQAEALARRGQRVLVILDRGLIDGKSYMAVDDWHQLLERNGLQEVTRQHTLQAAHCTLQLK